MGAGRCFRFVYGMVCVVFLSSIAALSIRVVELHRGNVFYEQIGEIREQEEISIWLWIEDTPVDYPVMCGSDNQYYLDHLPDGSQNALGCLFLDCRCNADSRHWIIYGHNGMGGKMFGSLRQYRQHDYFEKHAVVTIVVSGDVYVCPIFSVRTVEAGSDAYVLDLESDDDFRDYVQQAGEQSLYPIEVDMNGVGRVLTLSTCTGWRDQRLVIQALVPDV